MASIGLWSHATEKWAIEFQDSVSELNENGGLTIDLSTKMILLEQLAISLENEPETTNNTTKGSILALWILVVTHIHEISVMEYKYMCFRLVEAMLRRPEFQLQNLDFDFNTQDVRKEGDRDAWRHVNLFRKLTGDTFVYTTNLLLQVPRSIETNRFCATVAAHAFFVYPLIQASFVDVCTWRYCHHQAMHVLPLHTTLDTVVRKMSLNTHMEFMDRTPDLFHWGCLAKPTDPTILPDDSPWRLILDTSDGNIFCAFVQAFSKHVSSIIDASSSHISVVCWEMVPGYLKLAQLFGLMLYDALLWLHTHTTTSSSALFKIDSSLCNIVLDTAAQLTSNNRILQMWLPVAIAAISKTPPSVDEMDNSNCLKRALHASTKWIQQASGSYSLTHRTVSSANEDKDEPFQNVLLYPSVISLKGIGGCILSRIPQSSPSDIIAILTWFHTHIQRVPINEKDVLATSLLSHFFVLFLHWSPSIRACMHQILVYQLFRHNRRCLHLASDAAVLIAWKDNAEVLSPFCFDRPPILSDSPSLMLDLSLASKVDTYIFMLREPQANLYPEALEIFVQVSLMEYGQCLHDYSRRCEAAESKHGQMNSTDVIQGPDLSRVLAVQSQDNNSKSHTQVGNM